MTVKGINSAKLSNEGFAEFYEDKEVYSVDAYRSKVDGTIKFKLVVENKQTIINDPQGLNNYIGKFNKVIATNKIVAKDKVFFSSNSVYPRTSFNRYSDSARRIEKMEKADKIVVGNKISLPYIHTYMGIKINNRLLIKEAIRKLTSKVDELVKDAEEGSVPCNLSRGFEKESVGYYGFSYDANRRLDRLLVEEFKKQFPAAEDTEFGVIEYKHAKLSGTLDAMKQGYPITAFVTDVEVSRYIDSFKDIIDETSYPMLLSAFSGDNKQVTLAMKLIENMDNMNSKPYLYALFINALQKNRNTIINNKTYKSVGFNNVLETFGIKELLQMHDPYSSNNTSQRKLAYISMVYKKKLSSNEDKEVFLDAVEDTIEVELRGLVGGEVYDLLIKRKQNEGIITVST